MNVHWRRIWILVYEIIVMLAALTIDLTAVYFLFFQPMTQASLLRGFLCAVAALLLGRWGIVRLNAHIREWG